MSPSPLSKLRTGTMNLIITSKNRDEEQMSQNTNSNSASVIVAGFTGVTGPRVIKFGYKEFPVKDQRSMACRV